MITQELISSFVCRKFQSLTGLKPKKKRTQHKKCKKIKQAEAVAFTNRPKTIRSHKLRQRKKFNQAYPYPKKKEFKHSSATRNSPKMELEEQTRNRNL